MLHLNYDFSFFFFFASLHFLFNSRSAKEPYKIKSNKDVKFSREKEKNRTAKEVKRRVQKKNYPVQLLSSFHFIATNTKYLPNLKKTDCQMRKTFARHSQCIHTQMSIKKSACKWLARVFFLSILHFGLWIFPFDSCTCCITFIVHRFPLGWDCGLYFLQDLRSSLPLLNSLYFFLGAIVL